MDHDDAPDTVTLRVARVVYLMTLGQWMTVRQVACITGLSRRDAHKLLDRMSASQHVPVTCIQTGPGLTQKWGIRAVAAGDLPY